MTKDQWIQKAKALLFDCQFSLDSAALADQAHDLIAEGGGYDPDTETWETPLRWPEGSDA